MGRSQRGRLYHVGLVEDSIVDGLLAPTPMTALLNVYNHLRDDLALQDFYWSVCSFQTNGAPRTSAQIRTITDVAFADNKIDRQLRRKK